MRVLKSESDCYFWFDDFRFVSTWPLWLSGRYVLNNLFSSNNKNLVREVQRTWKKIDELSSFLIGRTFASRTWFGQFDEPRRSCVRGPKRFPRVFRLIGWNLKALFLWKRKALGQRNTDDGKPCFRLRRKLVLFCLPNTSAWHSRGVHCQAFGCGWTIGEC